MEEEEEENMEAELNDQSIPGVDGGQDVEEQDDIVGKSPEHARV